MYVYNIAAIVITFNYHYLVFMQTLIKIHENYEFISFYALYFFFVRVAEFSVIDFEYLNLYCMTN